MSLSHARRVRQAWKKRARKHPASEGIGTNAKLASTIVMDMLAAVLLLVAYLRGQSEHVERLWIEGRLTWQMLPLLILTFVVVGLAQVLLP